MARELVKRSTGESLGKITISLGVAMHRPGDTAVSLSWRTGDDIVVTRTDFDAPKHKGLTMFIVDMRAPGVEVRPI